MTLHKKNEINLFQISFSLNIFIDKIKFIYILKLSIIKNIIKSIKYLKFCLYLILFKTIIISYDVF